MQHRIVGNSAIHWIISLGSNICRTEPATIINWQQLWACGDLEAHACREWAPWLRNYTCDLPLCWMVNMYEHVRLTSGFWVCRVYHMFGQLCVEEVLNQQTVLVIKRDVFTLYVFWVESQLTPWESCSSFLLFDSPLGIFIRMWIYRNDANVIKL